MLPLAPPGDGNSPYQAFSAFAGNPLLISPDDLIEDGVVNRSELPVALFPSSQVDYGRAIEFKDQVIAGAWQNFSAGAGPGLRAAFEAFVADQADWLDDFALFMAIREAHPHVPYAEWPRPVLLREPGVIARARIDLADAIGRHRFAQFLFARQMQALRDHAAARGVKLIGDLPIFISPESADVWANPHLFKLDRQRRPTVVAGVPPDFFSATGQRWGNPHYDWDAMRADHFAWWKARLRAVLAQCDMVRVDHFRGFEAAWEIPAAEPTAVNGRWAPAPGGELFAALREEFKSLPVIAEDLGEITPAVDDLRERFGLPGMRILQFAFGGAVEERFLPHNFDRNCVAYTGTHDNDTTRGWYESLNPDERTELERYAPDAAHQPVWALIRLAWASVADWAIAPVQDVLELGTEARMNFPGQAHGNWTWRLERNALVADCFDRLADLTITYRRQGRTGADEVSTD